MSVHRHPLEVSARASDEGDGSALVIVVATEGSTYVRQGAMAVFASDDTQTGWLSGGCLEPEIARRARHAVADGHLDAMEIDTRDDEDLFAGSAVGCRGRLRLALLPLDRLPGWSQLVQAWWQGAGALSLRLNAEGGVSACTGDMERTWVLPVAASPTGDIAGEVTVPPPPRAVIFGAGPETRMLVAWLRQLGWHVTVVERRARWIPAGEIADAWLMQGPEDALRSLRPVPDAALVMHHHFEHDREALAALADTAIPFIGLLGPVRRREDLLRVIPAHLQVLLSPRLRSPIGLKLGGQGPEAIALSIAAQLQAWHHGEPA
ncbi:xanthine dehydrogenase accessory factor [Pseudoxanthomonas sp. 3HH-4]|uniref:XdhC family protein n=1 Tax=Pseudoxanthomonas sp. 3HH-4 TaxID=1690214 RepID=UPI00114E7C26|nr:XdhC/CoxI family protein [Pseudoxanthomonas sp. 3HH-4]TQM03628.1 xanthine dehydrogenase accessory factor [Pseudoxanthomonas sp. 3HH-4]